MPAVAIDCEGVCFGWFGSITLIQVWCNKFCYYEWILVDVSVKLLPFWSARSEGYSENIITKCN